MVADAGEDASVEFVTLVSLIRCGIPDLFVPPKGECYVSPEIRGSR
jgi:hypothetical protein